MAQQDWHGRVGETGACGAESRPAAAPSRPLVTGLGPHGAYPTGPSTSSSQTQRASQTDLDPSLQQQHQQQPPWNDEHGRSGAGTSGPLPLVLAGPPTKEANHSLTEEEQQQQELQQLDRWAETLRAALRANNQHQDNSQTLGRQIEDSLSRLYDLEYLARSLVEELQQPRNVHVVPQEGFELHHIGSNWLRHFHDVELPLQEDGAIFRRYHMRTRTIPWSKDELSTLKAEVNMELGKIKAKAAAQLRIPVRQLDDLSIEEEAERIDWDKVAGNRLLVCHGAEGCRMRWINYDHPTLNKGGWSRAETTQLRKLAQQHGERDWSAIASELDTGRTPAACLAHYRKQSADKKEWTEQEDRNLKDAIIKFGTNWQSLARYVGRNSDQCVNRWHKSLKSEINRSRWTTEEDKVLSKAVTYIQKLEGGDNAAIPWKKVATRVRGRTDAQCRERWSNKLDPRLKPASAAWTEEEDQQLLELHELHGAKWSTIAKAMGGTRTDNAIYRRFEEIRKKGQSQGAANEVEDVAAGVPASIDPTSSTSAAAEAKSKTPASSTSRANKSAGQRGVAGVKASKKRKSVAPSAQPPSQSKAPRKNCQKDAGQDRRERAAEVETEPVDPQPRSQPAKESGDGSVVEPTSKKNPRPPPRARAPPPARSTRASHKKGE